MIVLVKACDACSSGGKDPSPSKPRTTQRPKESKEIPHPLQNLRIEYFCWSSLDFLYLAVAYIWLHEGNEIPSVPGAYTG